MKVSLKTKRLITYQILNIKMNSKNYSELYNFYFNRAIEYSQRSIINQLIKCKEQGRSYRFLHNPILNRLNDLKSRYKLVNSTKYKPILEVYNNRNDFYEPKFYQNIFNFEMFDLFKELKEKEINYLEFVSQLAKVNALSEVYKRYRYNSKIYQFMFDINKFEEFALWEIEKPNMTVEGHELFEKYLFKWRNYNDPSTYKDYGDFQQLEKENDKAIKAMNFNIKEIYSKNLGKVYNILIMDHIDSEKTSLEDFSNVVSKDSHTHKSKVCFFCSTKSATFLLSKLKFLFKKHFSFSIIGESSLFYSIDGVPFSRGNISSNYKKVDDDEKILVDKAINLIRLLK